MDHRYGQGAERAQHASSRRERRAQARQAGEPVTVTRTEQVQVLIGADGVRGVVTEDSEPCYTCPCCLLWVRALEQLRQAITAHDAWRDVQSGALIPDEGHDEAGCLVCHLPMITWPDA